MRRGWRFDLAVMIFPVSIFAQTVPSPPTNVTARQFIPDTVFWSASDTSGGSAIIGYTATSTQDSSIHCNSSGALFCVMPITNWCSGPYSFTVTATNSIGTSQPSSISPSYTFISPDAFEPNPPTGVSAKSGNGQAIITWNASTSVFCTSATWTYVVFSVSPAEQVCTTTGLTCTATGLTNGVADSFYVKAEYIPPPIDPPVNEVFYESGSSSFSNSVTPATVPGPPTNAHLIATPTSGPYGTIVGWSPPSFDGSDSITGYKVVALQDTSQACTTNANALTCLFSNLPYDSTITFEVFAINSMGISAASSPTGSFKVLYVNTQTITAVPEMEKCMFLGHQRRLQTVGRGHMWLRLIQVAMGVERVSD